MVIPVGIELCIVLFFLFMILSIVKEVAKLLLSCSLALLRLLTNPSSCRNHVFCVFSLGLISGRVQGSANFQALLPLLLW